MSEDNEKLFGDKKIPSRIMIKRLWRYIGPEWKSFALALLLILINVGFDVVLPLFFRNFTNVLADTLKENSALLSSVIALSIGYFSLSFVSQIMIYFEGMILQKAGQRIVYKLRIDRKSVV